MSISSQYQLTDEAFTRVDSQNVDELIKNNTAERNSGENTNRKSEMRKVASIPIVLVEALKTRPMKDGGPIDLNRIGFDPEHAARFHIWLNDRDNQAFRTSDARV